MNNCSEPNSIHSSGTEIEGRGIHILTEYAIENSPTSSLSFQALSSVTTVRENIAARMVLKKYW